ncbi:MAG: hypothetical protein L0219_13860 [Phycisphaerales bacterium]|nr:hypothetical protein [Phycisphaerales bacterium]
MPATNDSEQSNGLENVTCSRIALAETTFPIQCFCPTLAIAVSEKCVANASDQIVVQLSHSEQPALGAVFSFEKLPKAKWFMRLQEGEGRPLILAKAFEYRPQD